MPLRARDWRGTPMNLEPVPWRIIAPHAQQAWRNHGQTLERLRERAGLSPCEALAILEDRPWRAMGQLEAIERLAALIREATEALPA